MKYPYRYKEYGVVPPPNPLEQIVGGLILLIVMFGVLSVVCSLLFGAGEVFVVTPF